MFLLSCERVRNWESTNFNLIPRGFSATFRLRGTHLFIFSAIVDCLNLLNESLFSFFSACPGLVFIGEQWLKKKERKKETGRVLWPDTNARIATVNIHTKIALSKSAKVDQISSLALPRFWYRNYHTVREFVGFGEKNTCLNLVWARIECLISALCWKRKDSCLRRCLNLREPVQGRVQQKIQSFMLDDCSQTERLWHAQSKLSVLNHGRRIFHVPSKKQNLTFSVLV